MRHFSSQIIATLGDTQDGATNNNVSIINATCSMHMDGATGGIFGMIYGAQNSILLKNIIISNTSVLGCLGIVDTSATPTMVVTNTNVTGCT